MSAVKVTKKQRKKIPVAWDSFPECKVTKSLLQMGVEPYGDEGVMEFIAIRNGVRCIKRSARARAIQLRMAFLYWQMNMRFGEDGGCQLSLEEIGSYCGVTRERIRQIQDKGIRNLYKKRSQLHEIADSSGIHTLLSNAGRQ